MAEEIKFVSHMREVKSALKSAIDIALEDCGMDAQRYAVDNCEAKGIQDTGRLKGSITYDVGESKGTPAMIVGTPVEYGIYNEYGTGKYAAGGRQTSWVYQDEKGDWHRTSGMKARPFIKPAIADHIDHYKQVIADDLKAKMK